MKTVKKVTMSNIRQNLLPFEKSCRFHFMRTLNCYNSVKSAYKSATYALIRVRNDAKEDNLQRKHIYGLAPLF